MRAGFRFRRPRGQGLRASDSKLCGIALYRIVSRHENGTIQSATSSEVLQEILHRYLSLQRSAQAIQVTQDFIIIVPRVLPVTLVNIERALELTARYPDLSARDLIRAAVMLNHDITQILSADVHFDQIEEIERIDPITFAEGAL